MQFMQSENLRMKMTYKIGMISLGCPKNQVDGEHMLAILKNDGFVICDDISKCDAVIVNTCAFIEDAKKEAIENIFEAASYKEKNLKVLAITGCLAERYQKEIAEEIPEADVILGIGSNDKIAEAIKTALEKKERVISFGEKTCLSMEGPRIIANDPYFAYLKIAEGCDNHCSYCIIPEIRGKYRSRKMEDIIDEAKELAKLGVKELNIVAQDTTRYGQDIYGKLMLPSLLKELCKIDGIHWIRIMYCYPEWINQELIDTIKNEEKIVKYIDLPLQHIDDKILKSMLRRGNSINIRELLSKIRKEIPNVCIRTTFIAGLPGEKEEEFTKLCEFIKEQAFERMGCFAYSAEEDTPAASFPDQVDEDTKHNRADIVMQIQSEIANDIAKSMYNEVIEVLVEGYDGENKLYFGRSSWDAPDIDTKVYFISKKKIPSGTFVNVKINGSDGYDLTGEIE